MSMQAGVAAGHPEHVMQLARQVIVHAASAGMQSRRCGLPGALMHVSYCWVHSSSHACSASRQGGGVVQGPGGGGITATSGVASGAIESDWVAVSGEVSREWESSTAASRTRTTA
jgi:hypothetical protein